MTVEVWRRFSNADRAVPEKRRDAARVFGGGLDYLIIKVRVNGVLLDSGPRVMDVRKREPLREGQQVFILGNDHYTAEDAVADGLDVVESYHPAKLEDKTLTQLKRELEGADARRDPEAFNLLRGEIERRGKKLVYYAKEIGEKPKLVLRKRDYPITEDRGRR